MVIYLSSTNRWSKMRELQMYHPGMLNLIIICLSWLQTSFLWAMKYVLTIVSFFAGRGDMQFMTCSQRLKLKVERTLDSAPEMSPAPLRPLFTILELEPEVLKLSQWQQYSSSARGDGALCPSSRELYWSFEEAKVAVWHLTTVEQIIVTIDTEESKKII